MVSCPGSPSSLSCLQKLRHQLPPTLVAGGGSGGEIEQPQGAAAGEWGGICVLSKQQPQCQLLPPPSSISPSQMFLHSHHPKGTGAGPGSPGECDEDGWRVSWGWCLASHLLASVLSSPGSSRLFLSWTDFLLAPTIVRASATNHLWGSAGGEGGKRDESGLKKNLLWFSRDQPRVQAAGRLLAQRPDPPSWSLHP